MRTLRSGETILFFEVGYVAVVNLLGGLSHLDFLRVETVSHTKLKQETVVFVRSRTSEVRRLVSSAVVFGPPKEVERRERQIQPIPEETFGEGGTAVVEVIARAFERDTREVVPAVEVEVVFFRKGDVDGRGYAAQPALAGDRFPTKIAPKRPNSYPQD